MGCLRPDATLGSRLRMVAVPALKLTAAILALIASVVAMIYVYRAYGYVDGFHGPMAFVAILAETAVIVYIDITIIAILDATGFISEDSRDSVVALVIWITIVVVLLAMLIFSAIDGSYGGYFRRGL